MGIHARKAREMYPRHMRRHHQIQTNVYKRLMETIRYAVSRPRPRVARQPEAASSHRRSNRTSSVSPYNTFVRSRCAGWAPSTYAKSTKYTTQMDVVMTTVVAKKLLTAHAGFPAKPETPVEHNKTPTMA